MTMDATRRQNYDSGSDYVLEYGELRFTFNELDFRERVEQAARKLEFIDQRLRDDELEDLVTLVVSGEVCDPATPLGAHILDYWFELNSEGNGSLVHWLRRLVFRGAWLDQRVLEGELELAYDDETHSFKYAQPDRNNEAIELATEPTWARVAYHR